MSNRLQRNAVATNPPGASASRVRAASAGWFARTCIARLHTPPADASYAHLADGFIAPSYEEFFADDPAAAAQLDQVYEARESIELSDRELLDLFRRGVRRSAHTPNMMFGWIASALGWPQDPLLTEILYQAMDPNAPVEVRNAGIYYGFGLGTSKTQNRR